MSLNEAFQKILDGIKLADEGRDEIMAGLQAALVGAAPIWKRNSGISAKRSAKCSS